MKGSRTRAGVGSPILRIGALAWVLGTVQFFAVHLIVESAWPRPYSWSANFISDLGAANCGRFLGGTSARPFTPG